jgi:BlaI family penicillinase repressor
MTTSTPTAAELTVLQVLWREGPSTVRAVHDLVHGGGEVGYTTTLKTMQNMLAKHLVTRVADSRQHVYAAAADQRPTLNHLVRGWIDTAFAGSSLALAMQALDARPAAPGELEELKALIARLEAESAQ